MADQVGHEDDNVIPGLTGNLKKKGGPQGSP
jgi:hypothetical protein